MKSTEAVPLVEPDPVMVRVTAPSNLAGGYKFDAVFNGEVFPVTVPAGGVRSGQSFEVPFIPPSKAVAVATVVEIPEDGDHNHDNESTPMLQPAASHDTAGSGDGNNHNNQPLGSWKTGLCDCLNEGITHPSAVNAWFCPQILMGQVLTRMKLGFCGLKAGDAYKTTTVTWILATVVVWYLKYYKWGECQDADTTSSSQIETLKVIVDRDGNQKVLDRHVDVPYIDSSKCTKSMKFNLQALNWAWMWTTVVVLARLRQAVRNAHGIRGSMGSLGFFEDLLCAFYCGCCTVSQLARETANYGTERAYYFSSTGMADEWTERFEAFEQRHKHGHNLVHAHAVGDQPHTHNNNEGTSTTTHTHIV